MVFNTLTSLCLMLMLVSCNNGNSQDQTNTRAPVQHSQEFKDYWFSGKAEISRYEITQARYGQRHPGEAIMVFVTEDFLTNKQVKHEQNPDLPDTKVLKLNKIKRFQTGMYDYSMMLSVFTPVHWHQYPHSLKVSSSSQDWCGQSYLQANNRKGQYHWQGHSYFQENVVEDYKTDTAWLEDELWTRLKMAPQSLPTGTVKLIPGSLYKRLRHRKLKPEKAQITQEPYKGKRFDGENLMAYQVSYPDLDRTLTIVYEKAFPHMIKGWTDKHKSGFGGDTKMLTTVAKHKKTIRNAYWTKNSLRDSTIRQHLNLTDFD